MKSQGDFVAFEGNSDAFNDYLDGSRNKASVEPQFESNDELYTISYEFLGTEKLSDREDYDQISKLIYGNTNKNDTPLEVDAQALSPKYCQILDTCWGATIAFGSSSYDLIERGLGGLGQFLRRNDYEILKMLLAEGSINYVVNLATSATELKMPAQTVHVNNTNNNVCWDGNNFEEVLDKVVSQNRQMFQQYIDEKEIKEMQKCYLSKRTRTDETEAAIMTTFTIPDQSQKSVACWDSTFPSPNVDLSIMVTTKPSKRAIWILRVLLYCFCLRGSLRTVIISFLFVFFLDQFF